MTENLNLHGRPIRGEIYRPYAPKPAEPWPTEKFIELLDDLFAHPEVDAVRWRQHTPSFNDGDPCVFGIDEMTLRFTGDGVESPQDEDEYEYEHAGGFRSSYELGDWPEGYHATHSDWDDSRPNRDPADFIVSFKAADATGLYKAYSALAGSLAHFEAEFQTLFGDPAQVTATREGFDVDYFDHD